MDILVTGGTGVFGSKIVSGLRAKGHCVVTMQRSLEERGERLLVDLRDESDIVNAITNMIKKGWVFDRLIHAARRKQQSSFETSQSWEVNDHVMVNALSFLFLSRYMRQYRRASEDFRCLALVEEDNSDLPIPYFLSQVCLQAIAEKLAENQDCSVIDFRISEGSADLVERLTSKVLDWVEPEFKLTRNRLRC